MRGARVGSIGRTEAGARGSLLDDGRGSGTVLALALVGAVVALSLIVASVLGSLVVRQRVAAAADAAALAGADVAMGAIPGVVCEAAAQAAEANTAALDDCFVDGESVTVLVSADWMGVRVSTRSRAGPSPE